MPAFFCFALVIVTVRYKSVAGLSAQPVGAQASVGISPRLRGSGGRWQTHSAADGFAVSGQLFPCVWIAIHFYRIPVMVVVNVTHIPVHCT